MQTDITLGPCRLICGDCLDVLPTLERVDQIITDPPYARDVYTRMRNPDSASGSGKIGGGSAVARMRAASINRPNPGQRGTMPRLAKLAAGDIGFIDDILSPVAAHFARLAGRWSLVFSDVETCHLWRAALESGGARYIRTGAWVKPDAMPQMTGDRPGVGFEPCTIVHAKGAMRWNGGGKSALWTHNTCKVDRPDHPCPKPIPLMLQLVRQFSDEEETVLDAFMGSGTTGIACIRTGRKFIGVEKSLEHFATAVDRIKRELQQQTFAF